MENTKEDTKQPIPQEPSKAIIATIDDIKALCKKTFTTEYEGFKFVLRKPTTGLIFDLDDKSEKEKINAFLLECVVEPKLTVDVIVDLPGEMSTFLIKAINKNAEATQDVIEKK